MIDNLYWHFIGSYKKLGYGDNRDVKVGETYRVYGKPILCRYGLHASECVMDALRWAPGPILCKVSLGGEVVHGSDKAVATERTVVAMADVSDVLLGFARRCALDVIHLWDAPEIVVRYLRTGDDSLRGDARADAEAAEAAEAARAAAARADAEVDAAEAAAAEAAADARYAAEDADAAAIRYAAAAAAKYAAEVVRYAAARADAEDAAEVAAAARADTRAAAAVRAAARYTANAARYAAEAAAARADAKAAATMSNNEIRKTQERRLLEMLDNVDWEIAK